MRCTCGSCRARRLRRRARCGRSAAHRHGSRSRARARPTARRAAASAPRHAAASACRRGSRRSPARGRGSARRASADCGSHISARPIAEHLPLAAGERAGALPPPFARARGNSVNTRSSRAGMRARSASTVAPSRRFCSTVWLDEQAPPFRRQREPAADHRMRRQPADPLALPGDLAGRGRHEPGDRVQRRGLSRAVGADQRDDAAARHLERHVRDADQIAVAHREIGARSAARSSPRHPRRHAMAEIGRDHRRLLHHRARRALGDDRGPGERRWRVRRASGSPP